MKTVHEVSALTGMSIRALQYYDRIGLLPPAKRTEAGYRLYDERALERLQQIMLFRALEFPLEDIKKILESPGFDRLQALNDQITLLKMRRQHLDGLIDMAERMKTEGVNEMSFQAFDTGKMDEYAAQARARWGETKEYKEFEEKDRGRTPDKRRALGDDMMGIFAALGRLRDGDPASEEAQALVARLQAFISEHYYACTDEILLSLGQMYAAGGEFTQNIDRAGGPGTADFANRAIQYYYKMCVTNRETRL